jgi:hypothetical protein
VLDFRRPWWEGATQAMASLASGCACVFAGCACVFAEGVFAEDTAQGEPRDAIGKGRIDTGTRTHRKA